MDKGLSLKFVGDNIVGLRVRALLDFVCVPKGTQGVIDEVYDLGGHRGVMVAWDLPERPLPAGYCIWDGKPAFASKILRDGFGENETQYLEVIDDPKAERRHVCDNSCEYGHLALERKEAKDRP